jgi:predicted RNA methylase
MRKAVDEALRRVGASSDPRVLALWYVVKRAADEAGVPDVSIGAFLPEDRECFEVLDELRHNLRSYVEGGCVEHVERLLRGRSPDDLYLEYTSHADRRSSGQFYTPRAIARRMISCARGGPVLDIGVGAGVFLSEAARQGLSRLMGVEVSPLLCDVARYNLRGVGGGLRIIWADFMAEGDLPEAHLWVSNPPYTRHHQIPAHAKDAFAMAVRRYGVEPSRMWGLYAYFFAKVVGERGRWKEAAFICPRPLYDSIHSRGLKEWLLKLKVLKAVEVFHGQRIFEEAETGPAISYLASDGGGDGDAVLFRNCLMTPSGVEVLSERVKGLWELDPALPWTNVAVSDVRMGGGLKLGWLFRVMRGVATGANDYFVLSDGEVRRYGLPQSVLVKAIAKTRYCLKAVFEEDDWEELRSKGREVYLLDLSRDEGHPAVRAYMRLGEARGIPHRPLVRTRRVWYCMERRDPPPIFVTYLSRGRPRFILNKARAVPLNVFLCLYPKVPLDGKRVEAVWRYLNSDEGLRRFTYLARNYGEDTLKVEPRVLENLEIPREVVGGFGLLKYMPSSPRS